MSYSFSENSWGEKYVDELNRSDFADTSSTEFFDTVLDINLTAENTMYIIVGSDSGLILPYLAKQSVGRGSKVVVIEHDDVYSLVANEYRGLLNCSNSNDQSNAVNLSLYAHSTWHSEVFDGSDEPWLLGGQIKLMESNASAADYSRLYTAIYRSVKISIDERINDISITLNRAVFTEMQFRNAVDSITPLKTSVEFGKGKTAVVLGAGPSLDLHLEWVKANQDKLFILAVSRLAETLIDHDLRPDLVVSVDPMDISYEVSKKGVLFTDVPLAYNYHVSAKLLQQWQGPVYYLGKRLPWHGAERTDGYVAAAGPSVGHTAIFVASQLGFSTILMSGIDFCFSANATSHANDSPEQMIQRMPSLCDAQVETYGNRLAGTSLSLSKSLQALDELGKLINRNEPILFNLSKEAGRCSSIEWIDIDKVQLSDKPDLANHMDTTIHVATGNDLNELERELKHARHLFSKVRTLCGKARECVVRMHAPDAANDAQKISHKLSRIRQQLEKEFPTFLEAIIYENGIAFSKTNSPTDFTDMSAKELTQWGCHYYNLLDEGAKSMIKRIDSTQPRIQLRRDELNVESDVRELMKRWRADGTPGRLLKWKRLNWSSVAPKDRAWVQRSIGKFRATLNEYDKLVESSLSKWNTSIITVMKSLVFLSQNQKLDELTSIESKLDDETWPYCALKPLVRGFIHEIQDDYPAALQHFQHSIDICSNRLSEETEEPGALTSMQRLLEECLTRMTHCYIQLEDHQSALTTLGMLCEILPSYIVSYAKMLNVCGQTEFAIELLESYIELYPGNKKARFLLTKLKPESTTEPTKMISPEYVERISSAVEAIMGGSPEQAA